MAENIVIKKEKIDEPKQGSSSGTEEATNEVEIEARIIELMKENPKGINDKTLQNDMPNLDPKVKVTILNRLLSQVSTKFSGYNVKIIVKIINLYVGQGESL